MKSSVEVPADLVWFEGELPDHELVPKGACVLAWFINDYTPEEWEKLRQQGLHDGRLKHEEIHGTLRRIEMCAPHGDSLNPRRWCDSSGHPIGWQEKVKYWAWVNHPMLIGKNLE